MDPEASSSSRTSKQCICICQKYCNAQPRLLSDTTFYQHLAEAEQDERNGMLLFKPLPLDSARHAMDSLEAEEDPPEQAGPSMGTSQYARRVKTERALSKRARETPNALHCVGKLGLYKSYIFLLGLRYYAVHQVPGE
jgi:hypothetical protein